MTDKPEKLHILKSLIFPLSFTLFLWIVKIIETVLHLDLSVWGIFPLRVSGLFGIVAAPLIHSNLNHLISNTFGVLFLTWGLFYFYHKIAWRAFSLIYFLTGFWVWFFARDAYHIGASGLIYGLATFLFLSGVLRKHIPLAALSLTVVFLYGGIIWGIFPTIERISWETHLTGLVAGIISAIYFKNEGPQRPKPLYDEDDDEEDDEIILEENIFPSEQTEKTPSNTEPPPQINYHYKEKE